MTHDSMTFSACRKLRKLIPSNAGQVATSLLENMLGNDDDAIPDARTVVALKKSLRLQDGRYRLKPWEAGNL